MKMKVTVDEDLGIVKVSEAFEGRDHSYSIKTLNDLAILHRLNVYYVENIYTIVDNYGKNLNPFENELYVFLGYEHDQLHFISVVDGNVYTLPAAMHGLRFYFNPNLNLIVRDQKYFEKFYNQVETPAADYSQYTWKRKCALSFLEETK